MQDIDHTKCPPAVHDFDPTGAEGQATDPQGRRRCNDCGAVCFYCTRDNQYHHAGRDVPGCFLVQEDSYSIPVPVTLADSARLGYSTADGAF